jgi:hypothetical protein
MHCPVRGPLDLTSSTTAKRKDQGHSGSLLFMNCWLKATDVDIFALSGIDIAYEKHLEMKSGIRNSVVREIEAKRYESQDSLNREPTTLKLNYVTVFLCEGADINLFVWNMFAQAPSRGTGKKNINASSGN